jgi:hypothetical protein
MNNPDHVSKSLETIFGLKYFNADPESGMEKFGSGMRKRRIRITENLNAIVKCAIISYAHLGQITFGDQDS